MNVHQVSPNNKNEATKQPVKQVVPVASFKFPFERRARSMSNPKQIELKVEENKAQEIKKKSPSPDSNQGDKS
jgi:hypothetical protein